MEKRQTHVSVDVEYETGRCLHCGEELFTDDDAENVDNLAKGLSVVIGGGNDLSAEQTPSSALNKQYRAPKINVKWFFGDSSSEDIEIQHICWPCAESLYGFGEEND